MAAQVDVTFWLLAGSVIVLLGWYFVHIFQRFAAARRAVVALPGALEKAFDGSVPVWLRLLRVLAIMAVCLVAAVLIVRKFGISF